MSKHLLILFSFIILQVIYAEEQSDHTIKSPTTELEEFIRSISLVGIDSEIFYKKIESLGPDVSLEPLLQGEFNLYFYNAFSEINNNVGTILSDRLFHASLNRNDFYEMNTPGIVLIANAYEYLEKRLELKLQPETKTGLQGAFVDPAFLKNLSFHFNSIIEAKSKDEKLKAESKTVSFLGNYHYRPWWDVLEEIRQEKNRANKKKSALENIPKAPADEIRLERRDLSLKPKAENERDNPNKPSNLHWLLWGVFAMLVGITLIYFVRMRKVKRQN